jgi:hypothetical protein
MEHKHKPQSSEAEKTCMDAVKKTKEFGNVKEADAESISRVKPKKLG